MRHLLNPLDFSVEELDKLMDLAGYFLQLAELLILAAVIVAGGAL